MPERAIALVLVWLRGPEGLPKLRFLGRFTPCFVEMALLFPMSDSERYGSAALNNKCCGSEMGIFGLVHLGRRGIATHGGSRVESHV